MQPHPPDQDFCAVATRPWSWNSATASTGTERAGAGAGAAPRGCGDPGRGRGGADLPLAYGALRSRCALSQAELKAPSRRRFSTAWRRPSTPAGSGASPPATMQSLGPDLTEVAARTGLPVAPGDRAPQCHDLPRLHDGLPAGPPLHGRPAGRSSSCRGARTRALRVPPGSIAIAMAMTSIYPLESPGGWHLIGAHAGAAVGHAPHPAGAARCRRQGDVPAGIAARLRGLLARAAAGDLRLAPERGAA